MTERIEGGDPNCEHEWEFRDESFDHEFGCEQVYFWECIYCEATKPYDGDEEPEDTSCDETP